METNFSSGNKTPIPETKLRFWKRRMYFTKETNDLNGLPYRVYYTTSTNFS